MADQREHLPQMHARQQELAREALLRFQGLAARQQPAAAAPAALELPEDAVKAAPPAAPALPELVLVPALPPVAPGGGAPKPSAPRKPRTYQELREQESARPDYLQAEETALSEMKLLADHWVKEQDCNQMACRLVSSGQGWTIQLEFGKDGRLLHDADARPSHGVIPLRYDDRHPVRSSDDAVDIYFSVVNEIYRYAGLHPALTPLKPHMERQGGVAVDNHVLRGHEEVPGTVIDLRPEDIEIKEAWHQAKPKPSAQGAYAEIAVTDSNGMAMLGIRSWLGVTTQDGQRYVCNRMYIPLGVSFDDTPQVKQRAEEALAWMQDVESHPTKDSVIRDLKELYAGAWYEPEQHYVPGYEAARLLENFPAPCHRMPPGVSTLRAEDISIAPSWHEDAPTPDVLHGWDTRGRIVDCHGMAAFSVREWRPGPDGSPQLSGMMTMPLGVAFTNATDARERAAYALGWIQDNASVENTVAVLRETWHDDWHVPEEAAQELAEPRHWQHTRLGPARIVEEGMQGGGRTHSLRFTLYAKDDSMGKAPWNAMFHPAINLDTSDAAVAEARAQWAMDCLIDGFDRALGGGEKKKGDGYFPPNLQWFVKEAATVKDDATGVEKDAATVEGLSKGEKLSLTEKTPWLGKHNIATVVDYFVGVFVDDMIAQPEVLSEEDGKTRFVVRAQRATRPYPLDQNLSSLPGELITYRTPGSEVERPLEAVFTVDAVGDAAMRRIKFFTDKVKSTLLTRLTNLYESLDLADDGESIVPKKAQEFFVRTRVNEYVKAIKNHLRSSPGITLVENMLDPDLRKRFLGRTHEESVEEGIAEGAGGGMLTPAETFIMRDGESPCWEGKMHHRNLEEWLGAPQLR